MATDIQVAKAKALIGWPYEDTSALKQALTAARLSEHKQEREGNRTLATYADTVIELAIKTIGLKMNISRGATPFQVDVTLPMLKLTVEAEAQHNAIVMVKSRERCAKLARQHGIDSLVKPSEQQQHEPPGPTVLKNAMYALIGAVFLQELDWRQTIVAMKNIGLVCLNSDSFDPHDLESDSTSNSVIGATARYGWSSDPSSPAQKTSASLTSASNLEGFGGPNWSESAGVGLFDSDTMSTTSPASVIYTPLSFNGSLADADTERLPDETLADLFPVSNAGWPDGGWLDLGVALPGWGSNEPALPISYVPQDAELIAGNASSGQGQVQSSRVENNSNRIEKPRANRTKHTALNAVQGEVEGHIAFLRPLLTIDDSQVMEYAVALCDIEGPHRQKLIKLIPCIASSTVVLSLKEVVLNARSYWNQMPEACKSAVGIGKERSLEQRYDDIKTLEVCIAHFQIAVRLHTYKLYEEHSAGFPAIRTSKSDPFVIETGVRSKQRGPGNPEFIETAAMTKVLATHRQAPPLSASETNVTLQKKRLLEAEKLRQTGKRLDMMVGRFGIGILAVVGRQLEDCRIRVISERALDQFLNAVEQFEGAQIRELSTAAEPVVRLLLADHESHSKFLFEDIDDELIATMPRCSPSLVNTFASIG